MEKSYYKSPIGNLEIICRNKELISLKLVNNTENSTVESDLVKEIKNQLDEYFSGKRKYFEIKLNFSETEFQNLVWKELQKIPYGKTKSYFDIAQIIGNKNSQRAVGNACNKNPIMIIIPCHRVISKSGKIGGFAYENSIKEKLLKIENSIFELMSYYLNNQISLILNI